MTGNDQLRTVQTPICLLQCLQRSGLFRCARGTRDASTPRPRPPGGLRRGAGANGRRRCGRAPLPMAGARAGCRNAPARPEPERAQRMRAPYRAATRGLPVRPTRTPATPRRQCCPSARRPVRKLRRARRARSSPAWPNSEAGPRTETTGVSPISSVSLSPGGGGPVDSGGARRLCRPYGLIRDPGDLVDLGSARGEWELTHASRDGCLNDSQAQ